MINQHVWSGPPGTRCNICGTNRRDMTEAGSPLSCIDRVEPSMTDGRPRVTACEDGDVIAARLAELRAERDALYAAPPDTLF